MPMMGPTGNGGADEGSLASRRLIQQEDWRLRGESLVPQIVRAGLERRNERKTATVRNQPGIRC